MTMLHPLSQLLRGALLAGALAGIPLASHAAAPNAQDDDLTATPVSQLAIKSIATSSLTGNDSGDDIAIKSVANSAAGAPVQLSTSVNLINYDPTAVAAFIALGDGEFAYDTFTYVLEGSGGADSTATVTVRVNGVNDAPTITGMPNSRLNTDDNETTNTPFNGTVIEDPDTNDELTVTVTINPAANGTFSNAGNFTDDGNGNYTFTGSAADATTQVAALNFVPTENRLVPGNSDDTDLTVSVDDGIAAAVSDSREIRILSINDTPVVNTGANRNMDDDEPLAIFSSVSLIDPDFNETADVTITFDKDAGSFSGSGFTVSGSGAGTVLTLTPGQSVANAQAALRALTYTPVPNRFPVDDTESLDFVIAMDDGTATGNGTLTVTVLSVNDAPVLAPANIGPFSMSSGSTIAPFDDVTLTDADFDDLTPADPNDITQPAGDMFTATIVLSPSPFGGIISSLFTDDGSGSSYTYQGTRTQVETAIQAVNYLAPGTEGTYQIALTVEDSSGKANDTSNTVTAAVTVTAPDPGMSGLVPGQQLADNSVIFPFASASFNNFGGTDRVIEVTLDSDAKGEFDILGAFVKSPAPTPFVYRMTGNSVSATDAIRNLRFRPTADRITGTSEVVTFTIAVKAAEGEPALSEDTLGVTVIPFNDAPTITGINSEIRIDDDETATPFAPLNVGDVDENGEQEISVSITLIGEDPTTNAPRDGGGTLAAEPGAPAVPGVTFTTTGTAPNITYSISGEPADVTTFLQALVFTPTADRNAVGERETIRFTLLADDLKGGTTQNQGVTVIVTSVNGAPVISGIPPLSQQPFPVPASGNEMTMPFTGVGVTDEDPSITFTIALDNASKGTLSTDDFTDNGGGSYSFTGTPTAVSDALQTITYTLAPGFVFPADQPGLTTFTLTAGDGVNTITHLFTIFIRERNVAHIVTSTANAGPGSLREAIDLAGNGDLIVFDFPVDDFPVTLGLESTLPITKNLGIIGSGVDQLTISGQGLAGIFSVTNAARLTLEQLTLKDGAAASYGGAVAVEAGSALTARYCEFSGNNAGQFGGAIDVFEGELLVENCLFFDNTVSGSVAKSGGAISIYSEITSTIRNSTFVQNRQENGGGDGGGAIYAENSNLAGGFDFHVDHCTFLDNEDAVTLGSAILTASADARVHVRNNIFADQQGQVLDIIGGGRVVSLGGNIATDATLTTFTVNSQNITLLDHPDDSRSTDPLIDPLADNSGATRTCAPRPGSPAIGNAVAVIPVADAPGTDQRGYWRGTLPRDIGALQTGTFERININEILVASGAGTDFIEFYIPRDSETLDIAGLELWIDGSLEHTFASQTLTPASGFAWFSTVDLNPEKGSVELRNAAGQRVLFVDYIAAFSESGSELVTTGQSINRYPRYEGGFLPHQRVATNITGISGGDLTSPGNDVDGSPLDGGNAPPIAVADVDEALAPIFHVTAGQTIRPDLLANDIEFDRADTLRITEVMALDAGTAINAELLAINGTGTIIPANLPTGTDTTITPMGATVTIDPDGLGITYDPTTSPVMIGLAEGETVTDIWAYTMRDFDESNTPQSRGADPASQEDNIIRATSYFAVTVTGVNEAPDAGDDIAATFENQAIRLLADPDLLAPATFDFSDQPAAFQDFDAAGNPVTLLPPAPTVALLANDGDVDSDDDNTTLMLSAVHTTVIPANTLVAASELGATVTLDIRAKRDETSILYDPRSSAILDALSDGETTTDSFHYSILDRHGARATAKVTLTITGVNDVPMARDVDGFVANQNASISILGTELLGNDTDPDGNDLLTIATPFATTSALGASLSFDGTTITYDPTGLANLEALARNETLTDTFTYTATDSNGGTSTATVTLVVEGLNDAPVAANDLLGILENQTTLVTATNGLLANDVDVDINGTDPDDDPWVIAQRGVITPLGAALDIHPDGSFRYDANSPAIDSLKEGELAVETFPYTVIDNFRTTAADDRFRILIDSADVNLPVLLNDVVAGTSPTPVTSYSADVDDAAGVIIESPNHALRDGLLVRLEGYEGGGGYNGVHPVTAIDRDHFSIPVAFADAPVTSHGTWIPWFNITTIGAGSQGGQLAPADGQSITYTPTPGFYGVETFSYTIKDGVGGQDVAQAEIEVILPGSNGFLSVGDDRFVIGKGTAAVAVDVLANDGILPAGTELMSITAVDPVAGATGTLDIIDSGRALAYTPGPAFTGTESFSYTVSGGSPATASATVTFEVVDRAEQIDAAENDFFVVIGSADNLLDVLDNDVVLPSYSVIPEIVAVNGDPVDAVTTSNGQVAIAGDRISYTPPNALLTDAFNYTVRDASGATTTRNVRVRVVPNAQDFFASDDHFTVAAGAGPVALPVLLNDGVVNDPGTQVSITALGLDANAPDPARVTISNGQFILYTPPPVAGSLPETFSYEIGIGGIARRAANVTVTVVGGFATLPDAKPDAFHVKKDSGPHTLDVLANDVPYPAAGWAWEIINRSTPSHGGSLAIVNNGLALSYTPAPGFIGVETFNYAIGDGLGNTNMALVTMRVGGVLTTPDHFTVLQDNPAVLMPVLANDNLLNVGSSHYTISSVTTASAAGGVVSITDAGPGNAVLYSPPTGFSGEDSFIYTLVDSSGGTLDETVTVRVINANADRSHAELRVEVVGINDVPEITGLASAAINDKETVKPFAAITITDLDESGDQQQTATVAFDPAAGTVDAPGMSMVAAGTYNVTGTPAGVTTALRALVFTPFENRAIYINPGQALVAFSLSLTDGYIAASLERSVTITVTGVNDPPAPGDDIASTMENQAIRLLADPDLLAPAAFDFGDLPGNFQDFDSAGNPVTLPPPPPTVALLVNDDDPDADDDSTTLLIGAVHTTDVPTNLLETTSRLGARVVLDIRADRREANIVYDPRSSSILDALPAGAIAEDSFYYSVFDRHGARGVAKVTIVVTGVNDVPMARDDDGFVVSEDAELSITATILLANDADPDTGESVPGDQLTIVDLFPATSDLGANLTFDGTSIIFDPRTIPAFESLARNESITDTFTYTATDSNDGLSTATVSVLVTGVNDAPVANNDLLEILENNTTSVVAGAGLLSNDVEVDINGTDPDDDPWIIPQRGVVTPLGAALTIHPDGSFVYDANSPAIDSLKEGELAVETFPYTLVDNFRTTASDDEFKVLASSTGVGIPVLLNDVVAGAPPVPVASYADDGTGSLVIESPNHALRDGLLVRIDGYEGDGAYNGVHAITSIGRDHFTIDVPFIDDPAATRGTWVPSLAITSVTAADKGGEVIIVGGQSLSYTPPAGFYGKETFTYAIHDGVGGQDVASVEIEVILPESNGFLSASDDHFLMGMGSPATEVDVLANDGILPGSGAGLAIMDVAALGGAAGSLAIVNGGKALSYTPPDALFAGVESFSYTVAGSGPATTAAMVTFEVVDRTGRLDGSEDDFFVVIGSSDNLLDVLANDPVMPAYPVDSQIVAVNGNPAGTTTPSGGLVAIDGDRLSYTPPALITTDTFNYTARDASGATATQTVRVRVVPNTSDFFASADHYIILAGSAPLALPVLANDGLVNEPGAGIGIINLGLDTNAPPDIERATISNDQRFIQYTPPATATTETFTYETSLGVDGDLRRRQALVTITIVESFSMFPEAAPDAFHVAKNSGPHVLDLLTNDIPLPDAGWRWQISAIGAPSQGGENQIIAGTAVSYKPADGFFGVETFTYEITDPFGATDTATVTLSVGGMLTAADHFAVLQDSPAITMPVLANDDLLQAFAADYNITAVTPLSTAGGSVVIDGAGPDNRVLYAPPAGFTGEDSFGYTVIDRTGGTRDETVTITIIPTEADRDTAELRVEITGINDMPVLVGTAAGAITDKETINPFATAAISDVDEAGAQQQTVLVSFDATAGTISAPGMSQLAAGVFQAIGTPAQVTTALRAIVFTPFENLIDYINPGQADVVFTLSIDDGYIATPILEDTTVTVTPVNDAPVVSSPIADRTVHVNSPPIKVYLPNHYDDVDDDVPAGQLAWTVTSNTNPALFGDVSVDAAALGLSLSFAPNQPGVADITVRGTDRGLLFVETTFRVTVEGPPVVVLAGGETQPPAATFVTGSDNNIIRDYRHAFRVLNPGTLPVSSFIVHVTDVDNIVDGKTVTEIGLIAGEYSSDESGTPELFSDDARAASGVSILQQGDFAYDVKYDLTIPPGETVIVHLTYRAVSLGLVEIRPSIRVSLSTPGFGGGAGISAITRGAGGERLLTANLEGGKSYRVESSADLVTWDTWPTVIAAGEFSRTFTITDIGIDSGSHPSHAPQRFYRLAEVPAP